MLRILWGLLRPSVVFSFLYRRRLGTHRGQLQALNAVDNLCECVSFREKEEQE